ncbi:hypothetical protein PVAND_015315 [Polypedilum vanderplanki]|uniref:Uncharacterized protein n=1 Tax=Polypedilum vanderplanki TaxID=319348 RepID=A0A9J6BBX7_POLVA|nr:hypothetical protein PVAND_015315 [Polypedilum vanderplanki]
MFSKISILFLFINIFQKSSQEIISDTNFLSEVTATCNYNYHIETNRYSCFLIDANITLPNQTLRIVGQHLPDHTDEHVQALFPLTNSKLYFFNGEIMEKFINLQAMRFSSINEIYGFSENAFNSCRQLTELEFGNLLMTTLPNGLFRNCHQLRNFNILSATSLTSLPSDLFGTSQALINFHLSGTQVTTLPSTIFQYSFNLRTVNLDYNRISTLDSNLFRNSRILESIDLSSNLIADPNIIYNLLNGMTNLRRIVLYSSGISNINLEFFNQFQWLDTFGIRSHVPLTNLGWNRLPESLRTLRAFNLGEPIPQNALSHLYNLRNLLLQGRPIGNFHQYFFQNLTNLEDLSLNDCGITKLHPQLFSSLHRLQNLGLSLNMIEELPAGVFANLNNLGGGMWESISLAFNKIRRLNRNSFGTHPYLVFLALDGNEIYEIERGIFGQSFPNLDYVTLTRNKCVDEMIRENFDENPKLEYCYANWLGIATTSPAMTTSTIMTTSTTDGGKSLKINLITILISVICVILIRNI